jgi:hypothetical protein
VGYDGSDQSIESRNIGNYYITVTIYIRRKNYLLLIVETVRRSPLDLYHYSEPNLWGSRGATVLILIEAPGPF